MTTTDITNTTQTVDTYLSMWNETDPVRRGELITAAWSDEGRYADPLTEAVGHDALGAMVDAVQDKYPGARFRRTTGIDGHHDDVRFGWDLVGRDGSLVVAGIDVGRVAPDGRLTSIVGFFGELPGVEVQG